MGSKEPVWNRSTIRAAIEKKGSNLKELALRAGLPNEKACQNAVFQRHIQGERVISQFLGVPLWELWPDRWRAPSTEGGDPHRIDNRRRHQEY